METVGQLETNMSKTFFKRRLAQFGASDNLIRRIFLAALVFHILVTISIYLVGRAEILPGIFDPRGLGSFGRDSYRFMNDVETLVDILRNNGVGNWLKHPTHFHLKLYSLSFALLSPVFGYNILSAELINAVFYLFNIFIVHKLGRTIFDRRTGNIASMIIALWPSLLLHTTQLLKTPFAITGVLMIVTVYAGWFKEKQKPAGIASQSGLVILALLLMWFVRGEWWPLIIAISALSVFFAIMQLIIERIKRFDTIVATVLILVFVFVLPYLLSYDYSAEFTSSTPESAIPSQPIIVDEYSNIFDQTIAKIGKMNHGAIDDAVFEIGKLRWDFYISYPDAGSNIDTDVFLYNLVDLVHYIPRAAVVGLSAPFPGMWFSEGGKLGLSARALSGLETFAMYGIQLLAMLSIWHKRKNISIWFLVAVVILGTLTLSLVVVNVGALYRFRYSFWIILVIIGVGRKFFYKNTLPGAQVE